MIENRPKKKGERDQERSPGHFNLKWVRGSAMLLIVDLCKLCKCMLNDYANWVTRVT